MKFYIFCKRSVLFSPVIIKPLSKENIEEAIRLLHSIFIEDVRVGEEPASALWASLEQQKHKDFYNKHDIKELEYFVVMDEKTDSVIGTTGLYTRKHEPLNMVWLGWYCVAPKKRGERLGSEILQWTIDEARKRGFKKMKLYTSDNPIEAVAQHVYEKFGFKLVGKERRSPNHNYTTLYRERKI